MLTLIKLCRLARCRVELLPGRRAVIATLLSFLCRADFDSGLLVINDSRFSVLRLWEKLDLYAAQVVCNLAK